MAKKSRRRSLRQLLGSIFPVRRRNSAIDAQEIYSLGEAGAKPSGGGGSKRDPSLSIIKRIGLAVSDGGTGDFEEAEWDFVEITNAYNTEAYLRQAVDKYIETMFKSDWEWVGKNPNAVDYIKMRFALMAEATAIPTDQLFIEIAEDLVKYCNVTVAKARAKDMNIFSGMNVQAVGDKLPVAGYFPLNLTGMTVKRDKNGTIKQWQQEIEGADSTVKFKADDIVHIYYKREKGRAFGTPWILPALEDVRSLRQIEENVLRLVYRHLHPMWHVKVGSEAEGLHGEPEEVDEVQGIVEDMDVEGGLVTTERVKIEAIASNNALDAKGYLDYFERRLFTSLGVSELLMGRGGTASRSTGDNLSGEFRDRIKALQKVMSTFITMKMVNEILMEGGFDPIINPDDAVHFRFNEIDMDSRIKAENQAVYLYEHNAISESELRELLGRDPIEDGEVRAGMHLQVITLATAAANAEAKAQAAGSKETDNKNKPTNQHGTKTSPKKNTNSREDDSSEIGVYEGTIVQDYMKLKQAVLVLSEEYGKAKQQSTLHTICQVFEFTKQQMDSNGEVILGDAVADELKAFTKRLSHNMQEQVVTSLQEMNFAEAKSTVEAVFDVYFDTLMLIPSKAAQVMENKQEVNLS